MSNKELPNVKHDRELQKAIVEFGTACAYNEVEQRIAAALKLEDAICDYARAALAAQPDAPASDWPDVSPAGLRKMAEIAAPNNGAVFRAAADEIERLSAAQAPEGWMLVPVEATTDMACSGWDAARKPIGGIDGMRVGWRAMLAAAPTAQEASKPVQAEAPNLSDYDPLIEQSLGVLVDLICPGIDSGDLIADAQEAMRILNGRATKQAEAAKPEKLKVTLQDTEGDRYRRMFEAACVALGQVSEALGLDPEDGGAAPILAAIEDLKAAVHDVESAAIPAAPAVQASGERERFEAWALSQHANTNRNGKHAMYRYEAPMTQAMWKAWESRAALASPPASGEKP